MNTNRFANRFTHRFTRSHRLVVALGALSLLVAACADGPEEGSDILDVQVDGGSETSEDDVVLEEGVPFVDVPSEAPDELVITDLRDGSGQPAEVGDTVFVNYVGVRIADGVEFDNNYGTFPLPSKLGEGRVIEGWEIGLLGMQPGARRQLDIPAELAYGDQAIGDKIRPGDALSFVVDMVAVVPPLTAADAPADLDLEPAEGLSDLETIDVTVGEGREAQLGDQVVVILKMVRGSDLEVVYDTWERNEPVVLPLVEPGSVPGLNEGLIGMKPGGVRVIRIPAADAFGDAGSTDLGIGPGEDLIVIAEMFGIDR